MLALSWGAIAVWVPLVLVSVRGRATFAATTDSGEPTLGRLAIHATNYSAMDDQAREDAYLDAARQVDQSTRPSRTTFK
jgi:hypothetical protein